MSDHETTGYINTKFGAVKYTLTEAGHVHISADGLECFGVPYHVSYHLSLIGDVWKEKDYRDLYLSRTDDIRKDASAAARKALRESLTIAWSEFIAGKADLLTLAERTHTEDEIERAQEIVSELTEKLKAATAGLNALGVRLLELGGPTK